MPPDPGPASGAVYEFTAPLWRWDGEAAWHFVTVPPALGDEIEHRAAGVRRGFGSVRVAVVVGTSRWSTSLFPDAARGTYLLPVRRGVRTAEALGVGDPVGVRLELVGV